MDRQTRTLFRVYLQTLITNNCTTIFNLDFSLKFVILCCNVKLKGYACLYRINVLLYRLDYNVYTTSFKRLLQFIGQQLTLKTQPTLITAYLYLDQPQTHTKLCLVHSNLKMEYFILIILSKVFKSLPFIVTGRNFLL